jgi:hypothetical protein
MTTFYLGYGLGILAALSVAYLMDAIHQEDCPTDSDRWAALSIVFACAIVCTVLVGVGGLLA